MDELFEPVRRELIELGLQEEGAPLNLETLKKHFPTEFEELTVVKCRTDIVPAYHPMSSVQDLIRITFPMTRWLERFGMDRTLQLLYQMHLIEPHRPEVDKILQTFGQELILILFGQFGDDYDLCLTAVYDRLEHGLCAEAICDVQNISIPDAVIGDQHLNYPNAIARGEHYWLLRPSTSNIAGRIRSLLTCRLRAILGGL